MRYGTGTVDTILRGLVPEYQPTQGIARDLDLTLRQFRGTTIQDTPYYLRLGSYQFTNDELQSGEDHVYNQFESIQDPLPMAA